MSIEENKAIIRRYYESFGKEDSIRQIRESEDWVAEAEKVIKVVFTEYYAPDCVMHSTEGDRSFEEELKETVLYFAACPDFKFTPEDIIAEGDKVVTRWTAYGTHEAPIRDIPATGKRVKVNGVTIKRLADGKVVEEWSLFDMFGVMQQLRAIPSQ